MRLGRLDSSPRRQQINTMTKNDERLIEASIHYAIAECGGLARVSTPYKMNRNTKMGVGFDYLNRVGYMCFNHRPEKKLKKQNFLSHRILYYLHHGELPAILDHIDGNPLNNSIDNLRAATPSGNARNCRSAKNSSSKYLGVCWHKAAKKWRAQIKINGEVKYLGCFTCEKEAARAYNKAAAEHFGEFANLNVIEGGEE
jgi:hypothetical protein